MTSRYTLVFSLLAGVALVPAAQAQFIGSGSQYYLRTNNSYPYQFYSYQYRSISGVTSDGRPYEFSRFNYTVAPFPVNPFANWNSSSPYLPPASDSMSGGYGSTASTSYDFDSSQEMSRQRNAIRSAQSSAKFDNSGILGPKTDFDSWLAEQTNRREASNPNQPALDIALINPSDEQLLSGRVLNDLAARILTLEAKGKKAASGLCAPELIEKIDFAGGPASDALNLFHGSKFYAPELLKHPDFAMLLESFETTHVSTVAALEAGKRPAVADLDRMQQVLVKSRAATEPTLKSATIKDARELLDFYTSLDSALKYLKLPQSQGIVGAKWSSIGVNIGDLVKHLQKFDIRFGRAGVGDEAAYGSLHRGLLAYYAALSQAK